MKAILFLIIPTIMWGLNFHLAKVMLNEVGFMEAGFWRYLFGVVPLGVLAYKELPSLKLTRYTLKGVSLVGLIGLFGFNVFFFLGLMHTTAINAALIISLNPALTILLSNRVLKTPISRKSIVGICVSFIGVAYLLSKGDFANLYQVKFALGDILILIANLLFALHHVWVKKYAVDISNINFTLLTNVICFGGFLIFMPFLGMENIVNHSSDFWLATIGVGCFGTAISYSLWNEGIKSTGADQAGIFMNIVPLSTAVLSVFFNESLYLYHLLSGLIIVLGVLIIKVRLVRKITEVTGEK